MRKLILVIAVLLPIVGPARAETIKATVNGLVCSFCATGIEKSLKAQPAVELVKVDLDSKLVTVRTKNGQTLDDASITKILTDAGYTVVAVVRGQ